MSDTEQGNDSPNEKLTQRIQGTALVIDELGPGGPAGVEEVEVEAAGQTNTAPQIDDGDADVGDGTASGSDAIDTPDADKPQGWDQVDFQNDDRAAIEARFHRLYGQVKQQERVVEQMATDNRTLYERMQAWEAGQQQQNTHTRVNQLQESLQEAMDVGDGQRTAQIVREMAQLESAAMVQPQVQQPAPQPEPQAGQAGEHPDVALIRSWAEGREFAQEGHKDRSWVAFQLNDLYAQPEWANRPITDKLSHIDTLYKEMRGGGQQRSTPSVLADGSGGGGRQRSRGRSAVDQLSAEQKAVAVHMFPEKAPREAYAAYARGLK